MWLRPAGVCIRKNCPVPGRASYEAIYFFIRTDYIPIKWLQYKRIKHAGFKIPYDGSTTLCVTYLNHAPHTCAMCNQLQACCDVTPMLFLAWRVNLFTNLLLKPFRKVMKKVCNEKNIPLAYWSIGFYHFLLLV